MQIVTSGQNKLSNGSPVAVDNSVNPADAEYLHRAARQWASPNGSSAGRSFRPSSPS